MVKAMVLKRSGAPLLSLTPSLTLDALVLATLVLATESWVEIHHLKRFSQELKPMVMSVGLITKRTARLIILTGVKASEEVAAWDSGRT